MSVGIDELQGGGKSWSPEDVGDKVVGTIITVERRQQTSFDDNTPLTWSDGSPRMLTYVEIQTDERADDDDDGIRALYAKGGNFDVGSGKGEAMEKAIVSAVKAAGEKSIDEGAKLAVVFSGLAKPTTRGYQPAKLYTAQYEPPKATVADDDLFGD